MGILTLTTDYGLRDYYVAQVKGAILSALPQAQIVDISHLVGRFNIKEGGFTLRHAAKTFPKNTVHLIGVHEAGEGEYLIIRAGSHFYIGTDNGIFTEIFGDAPVEVFRLLLDSTKPLSPFPMLNVFVPAAVHLAAGGEVTDIAEPISGFSDSIRQAPIVTDTEIRGAVVHVDHYGNLITNISKSLFEEALQQRSFTVELRSKKKSLQRISTTYHEINRGDQLGLFNNEGLLLIAVNLGSPERGEGGGASQLLGMQVGSAVRIVFE
jgi:S-adenosylmethionine hydrolase